MNFRISIPLIIAIYATCIILSAYFIEHVLGYKPCELCIIQRYPYYIIILSAIALFSLKSKTISVNLSLPLFKYFSKRAYVGAYVVIILASITGFSIATYHFGIENNYWQNFSGCSDRLSGMELNATNLLEDINKIEPNCSDPLKFFGLSLSGYNIISNLLIAGLVIFDLKKNRQII
tara:strand:- start:2329 stop:2859 length:531 start_codon:yes stop_codon:yes gene_type:complete